MGSEAGEAEARAPGPGEAEIPWRRLHPASPVINLIPQTWRVIAGFWPLFLLVAVGGGGTGFEAIDLLYIALPLASGAISTVVHYVTLRYRLRDGKLEIRQGLLNREARVIDPSRIQNVEMVRNPFHKLSGLVEVRMETAGDARTEGQLSALTDADARRLMAELDALRGQAPAPESGAEEAPPVLQASLPEIVAHGLSSRRAGLVAVLFFGGLEALSVVDPGQAEDLAQGADAATLVGAALLAFAVSWALSAVFSLVRHYGFTLRQSVDRLRSEEGLLTRRQVQVPLAKVQLVTGEEPMLRRLMGYGSLHVETAALGPMVSEQKAELVVPMVDRDRFGELALIALPDAGIDPWAAELHKPHPRALYRAVFVACARWVVIGAALAAIEPIWALGAAAALPISAGAAWLDWRLQGWAVTDRLVVSRRGLWVRRTWMLPREKLQSIHLVQGPVMRWHGLGRLGLRVAGSQVSMPDIGFDRAAELMAELSPRPAPRPAPDHDERVVGPGEELTEQDLPTEDLPTEDIEE